MVSKDIQEKKEIGRYRISFKSKSCPSDFNLNRTIITIDNNLKELIQKCKADGETEYTLSRRDGTDLNYKRYKAKGVFIRSIYEGERVALFDKRLVDTGSMTLDFDSLQLRDEFRTGFKTSLRKLLQLVEKEDIEETVTLIVRRGE